MTISQIRYKVAPTLLNAFDFLQTCPDSWKDRAEGSLLATLYREPFKVTPEIQKGFDFESAVQDCCEQNIPLSGTSEGFQFVVNCCKGGVFQKWTQVNIALIDDGTPVDYSLHKTDNEGITVTYNGKIDVSLPNELIDLKTTGTFKDKSRYKDGWQHVVYCIATGIPRFRYLVAEWESAASMRVKAVHSIPVEVELEQAKKALCKKTLEFFRWLVKKNLWSVYITTYCKNDVDIEIL